MTTNSSTTAPTIAAINKPSIEAVEGYASDARTGEVLWHAVDKQG